MRKIFAESLCLPLVASFIVLFIECGNQGKYENIVKRTSPTIYPSGERIVTIRNNATYYDRDMNGPIPDPIRYPTESNWYLEIYSTTGNKIEEHFLGTSKDRSGCITGNADLNVHILSVTDSLVLILAGCRMLLFSSNSAKFIWLDSIQACSGVISWDGTHLTTLSGQYDIATGALLRSFSTQGFENIHRGWRRSSNTYLLWGYSVIGLFSLDSGLITAPLSERNCVEAFAFGDNKIALLMFSNPPKIDIAMWTGSGIAIKNTFHIPCLNFPLDISMDSSGSYMTYSRDNPNDGKWEGVLRDMVNGRERVLWRNE